MMCLLSLPAIRFRIFRRKNMWSLCYISRRMGNGYYDRFLSILRPEQFIGVCWNMQILSQEIPMEDYDVRMTQLITETGLLQCQ